MIMKHQIYRVTAFQHVELYTLRVSFDDLTEQIINFLPILEGPLYGTLRDRLVFNQVRVDAEAHTLVWPNGADFDPETLHDWPRYAPAWIARAREWSLAHA
jgi:hypothetical protein